MNLLLVAARSKKCRLVDEVAQIRARKAGRTARKHVEISIVRDRLALRMHLENRLTSAHIRLVHNDLTIEAARTQESRIEDIRTVRRRDDDDSLVRGKPIHLHEQLVERLFALVVPAAKSCPTLPSNGVNLIDEDNAWCGLLRLFKQIAHARCADTDKHLDEVGTADRKELHPRLTGNRLRKERFTRARRSEK